MSKFTDQLWSDLAREHGSTLAHTDRPGSSRASFLRRPRVLAGSTLGMAGVAAAVVFGLSGSSETQSAYAVTKHSDGSVLVQLNYKTNQNLPQVNQKLEQMGTHEQIVIRMASGAAPTAGPVSCTAATGPAKPSGPPVRVLVGQHGTEVIGQGESAGNTAEGSFHLQSCVTSIDTAAGNSGAPGTSSAG